MCASVKSTAMVHVSAVFSTGGTVTTSAVDVTPLIRSQLTSKNTSVAVVDTAKGIIQGGPAASGNTEIRVGELGSVKVNLNSTNQWVHSNLVVQHFNTMSLSSSKGSFSIDTQLSKSVFD